MRTQQLHEVSKGNLRIIGFAGKSAPDHVDQLRASGVLVASITMRISTPAGATQDHSRRT
jgi:hypothetical protein